MSTPEGFVTSPRRLIGLLLLLALSGVPAATAQEVLAGEGYQATLDITFPTLPSAHFSNDYDAPRGGGTRVHKSTDLMGEKHWPLYAAVQGTICYITGIDGPEPSWGYHLTLCGDDGREYDYLHINNDTPGTDDGLGGPEHAYVAGIRRGVRVARGQHIAWMGDSGNAESTADHLHFEIHDASVVDPYGDTRINPYHSLVAALQRGDIPDGTAFLTDPISRIAGQDRVGTAMELTAEAFTSADHVVLAPADTPAPAIVAGPLAAALGGPVLTTAPGAIDERVVAVAERLGVAAVTVVGNLGLGNEAVAEALGLPVDAVDSITASDDIELSRLVAERVWQELGVSDTGSDTEPVVDVPDGDYAGEALAYDGDVTDIDQAWFDWMDGHVDLDDLDDALADAVSSLDGPVLVATDRRRDDGILLDGAVVATSRLRASLLGADPRTIAYVDFFLDDPEFDNRRMQRERHHPYDAGGSGDRGPGPVDLSWLAPGEHTLSAVINHTDGSREEIHAVFTYVGDTSGGWVPPRATKGAVLAVGRHADPDRAWPDSLMASWYGAVRGLPVLLTDGDALTPSLEPALEGLDELLVFGGTAAVSQAALERAGTLAGADPVRLSGPNRYDTALAIAQDLVDRDLVELDRVWAATGRNWPDATTAGAAVARLGGVLVLVDGLAQGADAPTQDWLADRAAQVQQATALGGQAAVSADAFDRLARTIT